MWKKSEKAGDFLKKIVAGIPRFLNRSKKVVLLVIVVVLVTLTFNFLIASWVNNGANNGEDEPTIPTTGTMYVRGLEIYGGDLKSEFEKVYIDWGELTLGASKNASLYIQSTSNVDVKLGLNVTNWTPAGIEDYIDISWDYDGTLLSPTQELLAMVNLNVSSDGDFIDFLVDNKVTEFGFDITIFASDF
jgi:hypothetical protein